MLQPPTFPAPATVWLQLCESPWACSVQTNLSPIPDPQEPSKSIKRIAVLSYWVLGVTVNVVHSTSQPEQCPMSGFGIWTWLSLFYAHPLLSTFVHSPFFSWNATCWDFCLLKVFIFFKPQSQNMPWWCNSPNRIIVPLLNNSIFFVLLCRWNLLHSTAFFDYPCYLSTECERLEARPRIFPSFWSLQCLALHFSLLKLFENSYWRYKKYLEHWKMS